MSDVIDINDYKNLEDIVKQRLNAKAVVICATLDDGSFITFVPDMPDIDLVYTIQTLNDRRNARLQ